MAMAPTRTVTELRMGSRMWRMNKHITEMIYEALNEYENENLYYFKFTSLEKSKDFGTNWHPGKTMHKDAALELAQFIKDNILGGE